MPRSVIIIPKGPFISLLRVRSKSFDLMAKKALLVGCNYPGTKAELHGCVNDVKRMYKCLLEKFGFSEDDITVLIDTDPDAIQPTGVNMRRALANLVERAQEGDILFFHYSGHGVRVPAESGERDDTGYDECIVPCDMNLITDDDFRELVDKIPDGCSITLVSDSCHSGGLLENAKEQLGNSTTTTRSYTSEEQPENTTARTGFGDFLIKNAQDVFEKKSGIKVPFKLTYQLGENGYYKNKSLPLSTFIDLLKEKTGRQDVTVGNIRPTLFDVFGDDASPKVKKFVNLLVQRLQSGKSEGFWGTVGGLAQDFLKCKLEESGDDYVKPASYQSPSEAYAGATYRTTSPNMAVLVSGCQSDETSADANPGGNTRDAYGALSNAVQMVLAEYDGNMVGNRELVVAVRKVLAKQGFKQHPGLYCNDEHADQPFICEFLSY